MGSKRGAKPRVALILSGWFGLQRRVMRGVVRYNRQGPRWNLGLTLDWSNAAAVRAEIERSDAFIAEAWPDHLQEILRQCNRPGVAVLCGVDQARPCPVVTDDEDAIGRTAAEHLLSLGLRRIGFIGAFRTQRSVALERIVLQAGAEFFAFICEPYWSDPKVLARRQRKWARGLKLPCGVFAHDVAEARLLVDLFDSEGVRVPEDVAVLTYGGDELLCDLGSVPLSEVENCGERVGWEAARVLEELLTKHNRPRGPILIPPGPVTVRQSTSTLAVEHAEVADALTVIRQRACRGLSVGAVLKQVRVSRRVLEYAFRRLLGRSIYQEILRVQVATAATLLATTDLPVIDVAIQSGFSAASRLSVVFKRQMGVCPRDYRQRLRREP